MANPSFLRQIPENTKKFVEAQRMYITENTTGTTYTAPWVRFESTKGTKITQSGELYEEVDDSNKPVVSVSTVSSVTVEGIILPRDVQVRTFFQATGGQSAKDRLFAVCILGAKLKNSTTSKLEMWVFPRVRFVHDFDYEIGGEGKYPFKFTALANDTGADITSLPLPTSLTGSGGWNVSGSVTTYTWANGDMYYTADVDLA
jgi:hypothetical protein